MEIKLPTVKAEFERLRLSENDIRDYYAIADYAQDKIYAKFQEAISKDHYKRRWLYELLQNAVDCSESQIEVKVTLSSNDGIYSLEFEHDGGYFMPANAWNKQHDFENFILAKTGKTPTDESTGKFGTGFLATHCLAHRVDIEGVCKENNGETTFRRVSLDREEFYNEDDESIQIRTLKIIKSLKDNDSISDIDISGKPSAKFHFHLTNSGLNNAREGLKEIVLSIQYVFACNEKLKSITIQNESSTETYTNLGFKSFGAIQLHTTQVGSNYKYTLISQDSFVEKDQLIELMLLKSIVEIDKEYFFDDTNAQYQSLFSKAMPSIYCSYPLIGSEDFQFPVIINSKRIKPNQERNGILNHNGADLNNLIISKAIELFGSLLKTSIELNIGNIYNLIKTAVRFDFGENSWIDKQWYEGVIVSIRKMILSAKMIRTNQFPFDKVSIINESDESQVLFVSDTLLESLEGLISLSENNQTRLDDFIKTFSILYPSLPLLEEIRDWQSILWQDGSILRLDLKDIIEDISLLKNLQNFADTINNSEALNQEEKEKKALSLINSLCLFVEDYDSDNKNSYLSYLKGKKPYGFIPSRAGTFRLMKELSKEQGVFDIHTNELLLSLHEKFYPKKENYRNILMHLGIEIINELTNVIKEEDIIQEMLKGVDELINTHSRIAKEIEGGNSKNNEEKNNIELILGEFWEWATEVDVEEKYIKEGPRRRILQTIINPKKSKYLTANLALDRSGKISLERQNEILTDEDLERKLQEGKKILDAIKESNESFEKLRKIGRHFEEYMKTILIDSFGANLVQHVDGNEDFKIGSLHIELKTTKGGDYIKMHPRQARTAQLKGEMYYLCIFEYTKFYEEVSVDEFKHGIIFSNEIGMKLSEIVINMSTYESEDENIIVEFPSIYESFDGMTPYKYLIRRQAWGDKTFDDILSEIRNSINNGI